MKLSLTLPEENVAILDEYARTAGLPSRSAAMRDAVRMLRLPDLEQDYKVAWQEWQASGSPGGMGLERSRRDR